jgi:hypothetical protein
MHFIILIKKTKQVKASLQQTHPKLQNYIGTGEDKE